MKALLLIKDFSGRPVGSANGVCSYKSKLCFDVDRVWGETLLHVYWSFKLDIHTSLISPLNLKDSIIFWDKLGIVLISSVFLTAPRVLH